MCGIAGVLDPRGIDEPKLRRMTACLARRGPDGEGYYLGVEIGLGHRRLAVIDTSSRASQPMERYSGRLRIVFNGEIYNFRALRAELEREGEVFVTASDTEVLLAGFQHWGDALWGRLRGMFACAIWDGDTRELTLARDPLGKKPLFWTRLGDSGGVAGTFLFASTLQALLRGCDRGPSINRAAVNDFLARTAVSGTQTIYEGIHRLAPGHVAKVSSAGPLRSSAYWTLRYAPKLDVGFDEAWAESSRLLDQAVERRLVADVPLGAFLSGGFDSGLVVASMARQRPRVRTFTAGTPGSAFDERALAQQVAQRWATEHTDLALAATNAQSLPLLLADVGQPFGDSSLLPSYEVARAARQHVTVVLTGDGGDESFLGYTAFQGILAADMLRRTVPFPRVLGALGAVLRGEGKGALRRRAGHVLRLASGGTGVADAMYNPMGFDAAWRQLLLREPVRRDLDMAAPELSDRMLWAESDAEDEVERYSSVFLRTTLPDTYLVKVDTATMATSLEARCPFLDVDLVEYMARVPRRLKFPLGRRKYLLRPLVQRDLPPAILRQPKRGFSVPVAQWLRGPLAGLFDQLVLHGTGTFASLVDVAAVRELKRRHDAGDDHQSRLWTLLTLSIWLAVAVDGTMSPDALIGSWDGERAA